MACVPQRLVDAVEPPSVLDVECLIVSTLSWELGRWSRPEKRLQGWQSLFGTDPAGIEGHGAAISD